MRWKETIYQRRLKRPIDEPTRTAISAEFARLRHQIPVPAEMKWHPEKPQFTIHSKWLSFVVHFTNDDLVVDAELSLTARILATDANRKQAVQLIDTIANDLGL
jgi:hypothetical protein